MGDLFELFNTDAAVIRDAGTKPICMWAPCAVVDVQQVIYEMIGPCIKHFLLPRGIRFAKLPLP